MRCCGLGCRGRSSWPLQYSQPSSCLGCELDFRSPRAGCCVTATKPKHVRSSKSTWVRGTSPPKSSARSRWTEKVIASCSARVNGGARSSFVCSGRASSPHISRSLPTPPRYWNPSTSSLRLAAPSSPSPLASLARSPVYWRSIASAADACSSGRSGCMSSSSWLSGCGPLRHRGCWWRVWRSLPWLTPTATFSLRCTPQRSSTPTSAPVVWGSGRPSAASAPSSVPTCCPLASGQLGSSGAW